MISQTVDESPGCGSNRVMRREADAEPSKDVAEPDQIVSGAALTGQENSKKRGLSSSESDTQQNLKNSEERFSSVSQKGKGNREVIGLGVLYNGAMNAGRLPDTSHCTGKEPAEDPQEGCGDCILNIYDRQDRIADRLNKKIQRLDRRRFE